MLQVGKVHNEVTLPMKLLGLVLLFVIPWPVAYEAPLSMEFSSQEYWSGLPFPSLGDLWDPGIEPKTPSLQADALLPEPPGKPQILCTGELFQMIPQTLC